MYKSLDKIFFKKYFFVFAFSLFSHMLLAGDIFEWEEETPHGNRLHHGGSVYEPIEFYYSEYHENIEYPIEFNKFFFDKNYIVASDDSIYYIINEVNPAITKIKDSIQLKHTMDGLGIKKHEWKDWNYGTSPFEKTLWALFVAILVGAIFIIYCLLLVVRYFIASKGKKVISKGSLFLLTIGLSLLLILVLFIL